MGRLTHPLLTALILAALAGAATAAPRPAGRAAPPDSFVFYQIPIDGDGPAARVAVSAMRPGARIGSALPRSTGPLNALADPDTTYEWFEHGFDRAASGSCDPRGWTGQERGGLVFAHVDNKHLTNDAFVTMGGKALWFGTDLATNPSEVAMWYYPEGFGANWSQRLTSPTFTNGNYRLTFDGQVGLQAGSGLLAGAVNRYLGVQALRADGKWGMLSARWVGSNGALLTTSAGLRTSGTATFRCYVPTHPDSQSAFPFATPTQLRIVVETQSITSNEDGGVPLQPCPGAIVDNVSLDGINSPASPIPLHDFEDGTTGVWTLSARNGGNNGAVNVIRDFPAPTTDVSLKQGFDPIDPSCVWQVAGPSGFLEDGVFTRITSPWIAWEAGSDTAFSVVYRGSLPPDVLHQGRLMNLRFRGKNAGDTYARRFYARPGVLYYGAGSSDLDTPVA
ncbi:MAG: hypothetical protein E6K81_09565, partial [Candidatus Eisenbacteria bacterium]